MQWERLVTLAKLTLADIKPVKAETLHTPNSILIYGPPGKGKTVFAGSIVDVPGFERVCVIDTEGSTVALGPWYPEVTVYKAPTAEHFSLLIEGLLNGELVDEESGLPYQAVIIDTFDRAQERQLEVFANDPAGITKGGERDGFYKWNAIKIWTAKVADLLHTADFLTIWVMHEDQDKNEQTGKVTTTVMLGGKSQQIFPSVPDIVAYFNIQKVNGEKVRVANFAPDEKLVAKQRFADKLDGAIPEPSMEKVFKAIEPGRWKK